MSRSLGFIKTVLTAVLLLGLFSSRVYAEPEIPEAHWWSGISFTPVLGARHLGLEVKRRSDGFNANISNAGVAQLFMALGIESPEFNFGASHWGATMMAYTSFIKLDNQFYDDVETDGSNDTNKGHRANVGTSVSGSYSYLVPMLHYVLPTANNGKWKLAVGYGWWNGNFSGDAILTPDQRPVESMAKTAIDASTKFKPGYMALLYYRTPSDWVWQMSVGGARFSDSKFRYQMEEISMAIARQFTL